jgi:ribosome biogenesis GTPase
MVCSAATGAGISEIARRLEGGLGVVVGQSGVGKSSLLNRLSPGLDQKTGAISAKYRKGTHTTAVAAMFRCGGFSVVDTPGVREMEIMPMEPAEVARHFPEFVEWSNECAYQSCLHDTEPGCVIREAVENGALSAARYEGYLRILASMTQLKKERYG